MCCGNIIKNQPVAPSDSPICDLSNLTVLISASHNPQQPLMHNPIVNSPQLNIQQHPLPNHNRPHSHTPPHQYQQPVQVRQQQQQPPPPPPQIQQQQHQHQQKSQMNGDAKMGSQRQQRNVYQNQVSF